MYELLLVAVAIVFFYMMFGALNFVLGKDVVCTKCGYKGKVKKTVQGSLGIEIILWLCFIIPGLIYTLWRGSKKTYKCPSCSSEEMVPIDSPVGRNIMKTTNNKDQLQM